MHRRACALPGTAGTTLTVCAINATSRELSVWNVGDSLALLVHEVSVLPTYTFLLPTFY